MPVIDKIRSQMSSFTPAERQFAEYILANEDIIYKSITLATEDSGTGYGTIIRFCQKIGFAGFQDFKIHLALARGSQPSGPPEEPGDTVTQAAEQAAKQLSTTAAGIDVDTLERVADRVAKARSILSVGVAGSYPTALELSYRLSRMGLPAVSESDGHMQAIRAVGLGRKGVLFAVSFSGSTRDVLDAARQARSGGACVVALTNYSRSPLADLADELLATAMWQGALESEIGSRLPFLFVVELLCSDVYRKLPGATAAIGKTSDSVSGKQI
jgi:RpiR family transcriptional regulator, carbohydrate utilization regulator